MAKYNDLVGQKFGRLTVVEHFSTQELGRKGTGAYWRCKCECGGETTVRTHDLIHGKAISCGCYTAEKLQDVRNVIKENGLAPLEKFRAYLCEKYEKKCYTNPMGKCPLANAECWNFMSFRELYNSRNGDAKKELLGQITNALAKEGYKL